MDKIILDNRYEIVQQIGVGGMAKVYKAKDKLLDRYVAIKILKEQYAEDEEFLKKFNNEAQSAAKLNHVNIVNVFDIGQDLLEGKKIYYIVMEYVEGQTLKELIEKEGPLKNHDIIDYSIQIAQALKLAHRSGIIHRDIKPQNILIDKYGLAKVTDFGIARVSSNATITYTSSILGTVHYISPEQAKGKIVDEKSDLYSLGALMYEMATGEVPFDADNSVGIAVMHIQDKAKPAKSLNTNLSEHLNYIIMKLLQKEPSQRFQNATELIAALENENIIKESFVKTTEDKTEKIPIVTPVGKKVSKKVRKKTDDKKNKNTSKEAVYTSKPEITDDKNQKSKPLKVWPLALLALILVSAVYFFLNRPEPVTVEVPVVINLDQNQAVKEIEKRGLKANISRTEESDEYEKGKVMEQDPKSSTKVSENSTVNLVISSGRSVEIPDLRDLDLTQAEDQLKEAGLKLGRTSTEYDDNVEKDLVISQSPRAGNSVQIGSAIDLVISAGQEEKIVNVEVPSLVGLSEQSATNLIEQAGLSLRNIDYQNSDDVKKDHVISQSIASGTEVASQSQIDLIVSLGPKEKEEEENKEKDPEKDNDKKNPENNLRDVELKIEADPEIESYNIKIYKLDDKKERTDLLYNEKHTNKELNEDNILVLNFKSVPSTQVEVVVDDKSYGVYSINWKKARL